MAILTNSIIDLAASKNGGWSKKQLSLIGVSWPPEKGWRSRVAGSEFPKETIEKFIQLKGDHVKKKNEKQVDSSSVVDGAGMTQNEWKSLIEPIFRTMHSKEMFAIRIEKSGKKAIVTVVGDDGTITEIK